MNKKELLNYKNNNEYINKQLEEYNYTKELLRNKHTPDRKLEKEYKKIFKRLTLLRVKLNKVLKVLDNMENTTHRNILYNIYIARNECRRNGIRFTLRLQSNTKKKAYCIRRI